MQRINLTALADCLVAVAVCQLAGLAIPFAPSTVAADQPVSDAKKEALKSLRGEWAYQWTVTDGTRTKGDERMKLIFFSGDKYICRSPALLPLRPDDEREFPYDLDVASKPWIMRDTPPYPGNTKRTNIIRITGDKLEICYQLDREKQNAAPSAFDAEKGSGLHLIILKRVKPTESDKEKKK